MNRSTPPPDLLRKYLNGTATPAEKDTVDVWYTSLRGQPDYLSTLSEADQQALRDETYQSIRDRLNDTRPDIVKPLLTAPARSWFRRSWLIASGLAAAVALIVWSGLRPDKTSLLHRPVAVQSGYGSPIRP